jgi:chondroitin 4-sulfotransferase 11
MIVNHEHKWIFIHIPKTGGEFIRALVQDDEGIIKHARAIDGLRLLGRETWDDYRKVAIVRNPFDLAVSMYAHLRKPLYQPYAQYKKYGHLLLRPKRACWTAMTSSFGRYVQKVFLKQQRQIEETLWDFPVFHFMPQYDYLSKDAELLVDVIYKFEDIATFLADHKALLPPDYNETTRVNASKRKPDYRDYYCATSKKIIQSHYAKDFDKFGYSWLDDAQHGRSPQE